MCVVLILSSNHVSGQTNPQTCKMVTTAANRIFLIIFLCRRPSVSVLHIPSQMCLSWWKDSHWLQWALGQGPGTQGRVVAQFTSEIPLVSAMLVGGAPSPQHETTLSALVCCSNHSSSQRHFWYINNYLLDPGSIAFHASHLLPPSLVSSTDLQTFCEPQVWKTGQFQGLKWKLENKPS